MNRYPGASIALSFALVAVFAVILYQPDHAPLPRARESASVIGPVPSPAPPPEPPLTAAEPLIAAPGPVLNPPPRAIVPVASATRPVATAERAGDHTDSGTHRPAVVAPVQEGFIVALEGETLRDVALRVYGSADEGEGLWRLNRDLVGRQDALLGAGTLLRTP
jgi:hypothetical protein